MNATKKALLNLPSENAKKILESQGYEVTEAHTVNMALQALCRSHYDIAILDPDSLHHDVIFSHVKALCPGVTVKYNVSE